MSELVKPERAKVNRKAHRERWWQFGDKRPALRQAIRELHEVLVIARTSSNVMPVRVSSDTVFSDSLNVFATDSSADQAALSSSLHQLWAITYGWNSRDEDSICAVGCIRDLSRSDHQQRQLQAVGRELEGVRSEIMIRRDLRLTALYNLVNDAVGSGRPRRRQPARAARSRWMARRWQRMAGMTSPLDHGFHTYRQMERWTVSPAARVEVLDRLLELNHERARAEGQARTGSEFIERTGHTLRMTVSASTTVRADLVALIEQELLGPRNGPEEEIRGTPRAAYMVGCSGARHHRPQLWLSWAARTTAQTLPKPGIAVTDLDPIDERPIRCSGPDGRGSGRGR